MKLLYLLIGPKGAGKTHIGMLAHRETDIQFIQVEPIWLNLQPGENGWQKVEAVIDANFRNYDQVMIESLGAGEEFAKFHASLATKYTLKLIRVYADLDVCLQRVKHRSRVNHIPLSDEQVENYNQIAATVSFDWALEIDNNIPLPDDVILADLAWLQKS